MDRRQKVMRTIGFAIALSAPVTAIISYAMFSVVFGEERFEGSDGTTLLGFMVLALPLILGLAIAAWAHFVRTVPTMTQVANVAGIFAVLCIVLGVWSVLNSGTDASIGGGLLVLFGLGAMAVSVGLRLAARRPRPTPPPPPAPTA